MGKKIDPFLSKRFSKVFEKKLWGDRETISGPGSRKDNPMVVRALEALDYVIQKYNIIKISDIPCGDFNWFKAITDKHKHLEYVGYDIVKKLIIQNHMLHPNIRFEHFDIVSDVPEPSDLIFTKELLIHLTNKDIFSALRNMKESGSRYLMASNSFGVENIDLSVNSLGYARPVDLCRPPFNFSSVLWNNAFYALWDFSSIKIH